MKKNNKVIGCMLFFALLIITAGCGDDNKKSAYDTPKQGTINISVDESFEPVISEQIKVYESSYPETKIIASYKSEADCFRDLGKDSTRMIIVAKGLTKEEKQLFTDKLSYAPNFDILAYDAVSVIINKDAKDSVFTLQQLQDMLSGKDSSKNVVVDGNNATSTVRFLLDSVLRGKSFSSKVMAANGSKSVVDYVSKNADAIGFVGSSWVTNDQDPEQLAYRDKIRFALLECRRNCDSGSFAKPSQATITYGQYPLVRPLYYILKENSTGLGTGFTNYLNLERGQLVFRRSFLVPAKMYFGLRKSNVE
ncbi:phosphate ABC transporter substrate-binding protein, PhoT family [Panacibacter ginsenosidivorans]|uniref:Phosphate ABC transporter substrate-binding protein, PhoT family n=1 Tax=Panacibacter ginsenosidivorans TaxID=1813871 RepID=A0A5B8VEE3_9BACT|nr:substrate-binding domain-containing protein [Panacibacter ginsenosidivorans]QEC68996.1 phosphate ABC transporter substrate-binding protein, PhoT family [Panacibacter ginsenosidivorans]